MMAGSSTLLFGMQVRKVLAAQQQLPNPQTTSIESLQHLTGLSERTVTSALQASRLRELSLEAATTTSTPAGKAQERTPLVDQISSSDLLDHHRDLDDPLADTCVAETLMEGSLQKLPHEEATVLHHVYGLQDGLPKSRPQVSHAALPQKVCRQTAASSCHCYMHLCCVYFCTQLLLCALCNIVKAWWALLWSIWFLGSCMTVISGTEFVKVWRSHHLYTSSSVATNVYIVQNLLGACLVWL